MDQKTFIIVGVAIALVIAIVAPFLASGNPDGLESAFFGIHGAKDLTGDELDEEAAGLAEEHVVGITGNDFSFEPLLPDYTLPGADKPGEIIAIIIGTLVMFGLVYGIARVTARPGR
jgi:cobalt/nickel transport protein